jgi:hypothetical protein
MPGYPDPREEQERVYNQPEQRYKESEDPRRRDKSPPYPRQHGDPGQGRFPPGPRYDDPREEWRESLPTSSRPRSLEQDRFEHAGQQHGRNPDGSWEGPGQAPKVRVRSLSAFIYCTT